MHLFERIVPLPEDPIFGLYAAFQADPRPEKINLAIGIYMDDQGKVPFLECVRRAEMRVVESGKAKAYLPIDGLPVLLKETEALIYGSSDAPRLTVQTVGGTGALSIGAEFLKAQGMQRLYLPDPSWSNHRQIFERAGLQVASYPYYNQQRLDFEGMCAFLSQLAAKSILLLQVCCHNPTGIDLSLSQWQELGELIQKKQFFPFFDFAYQGFATGLVEDAAPIRLFAERGHPFMVSSSFSKNLGLYGERVGLLSLVHAPKSLLSHIKLLIRSSYSNPPLHGACIAATILQSVELKKLWESELTAMRQRLIAMRRKLGKKLKREVLGSGLFCMFGLTPSQVQKLREEKGVYLLENGRLNLAGLTDQNLDFVAHALRGEQ